MFSPADGMTEIEISIFGHVRAPVVLPLLPMTLGIGEGETRSEGTKTKMRSTLYYRQYKQFNSRAPAVLAHTLVRQLAIFP